MPAELRKRPAPKEDSAPAAKRSASKPRAPTKAKQVVEKVKGAVTGDSSTAPAAADPEPVPSTASKAPEPTSTGTAGAKPDPAPTVEKAKPSAAAAATTPLSSTSINKTLPPTALTTATTTHTGAKSTLSTLLSSSTNGIIIFTYPKASTPGCTTQACLFRDTFDPLLAKGYTVYGLSADSEKANANFKTKQGLQYDMLCDPGAELTGVLGMKKSVGKGTVRGVVVLGKDGKVEVWEQAGPARTVEAVKGFLGL